MNNERLTTGDVHRTIGFHVSAEVIKQCGVHPAFETGNGIYWRKQDLPRICAGVAKRLIDRASALIEEQAA